MKTIAGFGHLEEELYLTTFLWEEAKHVDFFQRTIDSRDVSRKNLAVHQVPSYMKFFGDTFSSRMNILYDAPSPENLLRALATYNLSIERVVAETGYYAWY
jgi:ribonucleoside-diphosphate reductase beta chain